MSSLFYWLFRSDYIPHGHCYLWQPRLVSLHLISDLLTAIAYFSISVLLLIFLKRRKDIPFGGTFALFGASIFCCGLTHAIEIWLLWHPMYWLSGTVKAVTAVISLFTVIEIIQVLPKALNLTSPAELETANQTLSQQIQERRQVEENLRQSAAMLQRYIEFESLLKRITDKVRDSLDERQILQAAVQELGRGLNVKSCNAAIYDVSAGTSTVFYEHTTSTVPVQGRIMSMATSPEIYDQLLSGQYFQCCSLLPNADRGRVAMLACPMIDDQGVLGDLWLIKNQTYAFQDSELRLVQQVANQCAIAIRQARLYQAAQAQVQELIRLNQLKDDFLSTVSHELRTPVANIKVASRMLELTLDQLNSSGMTESTSVPLTTKVNHYLSILQSECQREIRLIEDLLDLRRMEDSRVPLSIQSIDLHTWLPTIIKPFEALAQTRQQTLTLAPFKANPPTLATDPISLERALTELLQNACKYTPSGESIHLDIENSFQTVYFKITNTGVEIPSCEISQIFNKFYRIPSADPWKQGGTGLGLALVEKLAMSLGGTIAVRSHSNQTIFTLALPHRPSVESATYPNSAIPS